jgi:hypothetical protein
MTIVGRPLQRTPTEIQVPAPTALQPVTSANRADGKSEIEGKAAKGSGERVGKRSEFQIRGSEVICIFRVTSRQILRITGMKTQKGRIETYEQPRWRNNNYHFSASPSLAWARRSIGCRDMARPRRNARQESKRQLLNSICVAHGFLRHRNRTSPYFWI